MARKKKKIAKKKSATKAETPMVTKPVVSNVTSKKKPPKSSSKVISQTVGKVKIAKVVEKIQDHNIHEVEEPQKSEGLNFVDKKVADKIGEQLLARIISGEKYGSVNLENWGTGTIASKNQSGAKAGNDSFRLLNRVVTKKVIEGVEVLVVEETKAVEVHPNSVIMLYTISQQNPDKSWSTTPSMILLPENEIKEIPEDVTGIIIDRMLVRNGMAKNVDRLDIAKKKMPPPTEKVVGFTPGKPNFAKIIE